MHYEAIDELMYLKRAMLYDLEKVIIKKDLDEEGFKRGNDYYLNLLERLKPFEDILGEDYYASLKGFYDAFYDLSKEIIIKEDGYMFLNSDLLNTYGPIYDSIINIQEEMKKFLENYNLMLDRDDVELDSDYYAIQAFRIINDCFNMIVVENNPTLVENYDELLDDYECRIANNLNREPKYLIYDEEGNLLFIEQYEDEYGCLTVKYKEDASRFMGIEGKLVKNKKMRILQYCDLPQGYNESEGTFPDSKDPEEEAKKNSFMGKLKGLFKKK